MSTTDRVAAPLVNQTDEPPAPNQNYESSNGAPGPDFTREVQPSADTSQDDVEDEDALEDIFAEDSDGDGQDWDPESRDLTKSFNRQRQLHEAGSGAVLPRSNRQKPMANTAANIDDQISALSRHAAKIRLDDVKQDQNREKDKADRATSEQVLDRRTRMILLQMINRGIVNEVHGAISTGKEANVYSAVLFPDNSDQQDAAVIHRAIKVYKTAILSFKDRERYITGEHRFRGGYDKGNHRKMVKLWAEKEYRNLRRIHAAGIPCPEPICLKLHVLVMGFLGDQRGWAYPRLRDAVLAGSDADQQWYTLYTQLLGIMRRMYHVCRLVHADLSEYNILYNDMTLYVIDVSQSVEPDHPRSLEFLRMDIKNVGDFFRRKGVDTPPDRAVFDFITASDGPLDNAGIATAIELLGGGAVVMRHDMDAAAQAEVDTEVFRNQFIPQTLEQVYDIERDAQQIGQGRADQLVYRNLLADKVGMPKVDAKAANDAAAETAAGPGDIDAAPSHSGESISGDNDSSQDEDLFEKKRLRGRKFDDKDEKKAHKQSVKDAKREKRKEKMPKYVKKKLVAATARKK